MLAFEARLLKDQALKIEGAPRRAGLLASAAAYRQVYEKKAGLLPAINWASLTFLAGAEGSRRRRLRAASSLIRR